MKPYGTNERQGPWRAKRAWLNTRRHFRKKARQQGDRIAALEFANAIQEEELTTVYSVHPELKPEYD